MVNNKTLLKIGDWFIFIVTAYMFAKGVLSDMSIIDGYSNEQIITFAWASMALNIILGWIVVLRPMTEVEKTPTS